MFDSSKTYGLFDNGANKSLIKKLETARCEVFLFPVVPNIGCGLNDSMDECLSNLNRFDWVIFTDVFCVDQFIEYLERANVSLFDLDDVRVCAYGESVADRLRFVQLHADVIANKIDDKAILDQIDDYLIDSNEFAGLNVLFVKGKQRAFLLFESLRAANADVTELNVYEFASPENSLKYLTLAENGAFDEFIFTSVDDVFSLSNLFYPKQLLEVFAEVNVVAQSEIVFQTLLEFGFSPKLLK